jgi:hypothetical protein
MNLKLIPVLMLIGCATTTTPQILTPINNYPVLITTGNICNLAFPYYEEHNGAVKIINEDYTDDLEKLKSDALNGILTKETYLSKRYDLETNVGEALTKEYYSYQLRLYAIRKACKEGKVDVSIPTMHKPE